MTVMIGTTAGGAGADSERGASVVDEETTTGEVAGTTAAGRGLPARGSPSRSETATADAASTVDRVGGGCAEAAFGVLGASAFTVTISKHVLWRSDTFDHGLMA